MRLARRVAADYGGRIWPVRHPRLVPQCRFPRLIVLLPCHSLEDFPLYFEGDAAAGLLAAWTGPWHPRLIAAAGKGHLATGRHAAGRNRRPIVCGAAGGRRSVAPRLCRPCAGRGRARDLRCPHARGRGCRGAGRLRANSEGSTEVSADLVADFHALGYCLLQVELLTRQMRYASNLDESAFGQVVVTAAQLAVRGDEAAARQSLQGAFNLLAAARQISIRSIRISSI